MKILLDTHVLLWTLYEPDKIPPKLLTELETRANKVLVSSINISEIMIKASLGKLNIEDNILQAITESGFELKDYPAEASMLLKDLPFHHRDPFDRMLITQAIAGSYWFMTVDEKIGKYEVKLINQ